MKDLWVSFRYSNTGRFLKNYGGQFAITFVMVLSLVGVLAGAQLIQRRTFNDSKAQVASLRKLKIVEVLYLPPNSSLNQNMSTLTKLRSSAKLLISRASAYHDGQIKAIEVENVYPGYERFTSRPNPDGTYQGSLRSILADGSGSLSGQSKSICDVIKENNIDQVWIWADPIDGVPSPEYAILSPNSNYGSNSTFCDHDKSFTIIALDITRGNSNILHTFGHYMEYLLERIQGRELFVNRYMGVEYTYEVSPNADGKDILGYNLSERCGSVHVPPNSVKDQATGVYPAYFNLYTYDVPANSGCYNWTPDQNFSNVPKSPIRASVWRALWQTEIIDPLLDETQGGYLLWWFQNMPNAGNTLKYNFNNVEYSVPNWWDFVADTDNTIRYYMDAGYWMNPDLQRPSGGTLTTSTFGTSGTQSDWTHTPTSSNTLGISDPAVLSTVNAQTAIQYVNMALVTASYRPIQNPSAQLTSVRYCGREMARVGGTNGLAKYGIQASEMWYLLNPPSGNCEVIGIFSADPGERIMSATVFNNIDSSQPIAGIQKAGIPTTSLTNTSNEIKISMSGPKDSVTKCNLSTKGGMIGGLQVGGQVHPDSISYNLWYRNETNLLAQLAMSYQRTSDNQVKTLQWSSYWGDSYRYPWALMCTNFKVKPFMQIGTPPPTHPPLTPTPVPVTPPPSSSSPSPSPSPVPVTPTPTPYTGNPVYTCWDRVVSSDDLYYWPSSCDGALARQIGVYCTTVLRELSATERIAYQDWITAGRPPTSCSGGPTPPPYVSTVDTYSIARGAFLTENNLITVQAENYDKNIPRSNHQWELKTGTSGYTGEGFMRSLPNGVSGGSNTLSLIPTTQAELKYKLYFAQAGTYYVWLRGRGPDGNSDTVHIGVNSVVSSTSDKLTLPNTSTIQWRSATYDGPRPTINIPAPGRYNINLYMREDGAMVDQLLFTTSSSYVPSN